MPSRGRLPLDPRAAPRRGGSLIENLFRRFTGEIHSIEGSQPLERGREPAGGRPMCGISTGLRRRGAAGLTAPGRAATGRMPAAARRAWLVAREHAEVVALAVNLLGRLGDTADRLVRRQA